MNSNRHTHELTYSKLLVVLLYLFALTGITVVASGFDFGALNIWVALTIASVKSALVLLFFMHLKYESGLLKLTFAITIFSLAIVIALIFWDVAYR